MLKQLADLNCGNPMSTLCVCSVYTNLNSGGACAIVRGKITGAGMPIYAIWHCPLGFPSAIIMRRVAHRRL